MTNAHECFLYSSVLSSSCDMTCVPDIIKTARSFNEKHCISGMLIFDGVHFVQYLEGPKAWLLPLLDRIAVDPRHTNFLPHYQRECKERMFKNWSIAYSYVDDANALAGFIGLTGDSAFEKFREIMPELDAA